MENMFLRVICIDENDPFGYRVLEDENRGSLDEVNEFLKEKLPLHRGARWLLLPGTVTN